MIREELDRGMDFDLTEWTTSHLAMPISSQKEQEKSPKSECYFLSSIEIMPLTKAKIYSFFENLAVDYLRLQLFNSADKCSNEH